MNKNTLMTVARFWNKVKVVPETNSQECWEWQGATTNNKNSHNYGICSTGNGKTELAHRFVAGLSEDIEGLVVRHRCDNTLCVRPDHLLVGDQQSNMRDMYERGRQNSKLTIDAVRDIRTRSLSRAEYAEKYGISQYTVGEVQRGQTWSWVK